MPKLPILSTIYCKRLLKLQKVSICRGEGVHSVVHRQLPGCAARHLFVVPQNGRNYHFPLYSLSTNFSPSRLLEERTLDVILILHVSLSFSSCLMHARIANVTFYRSRDIAKFLRRGAKCDRKSPPLPYSLNSPLVHFFISNGLDY